MLLPIYLGFITHEPIVPAVMEKRLKTLLRFFSPGGA